MIDVAGVEAGQVRARCVGSSAGGWSRSWNIEGQSRVCSLLASFVRHLVVEVLTKSGSRHQCNVPLRLPFPRERDFCCGLRCYFSYTIPGYKITREICTELSDGALSAERSLHDLLSSRSARELTTQSLYTRAKRAHHHAPGYTISRTERVITSTPSLALWGRCGGTFLNGTSGLTLSRRPSHRLWR